MLTKYTHFILGIILGGILSVAAQTFAAPITPKQGGTGLSTAPSVGQLLVGTYANVFRLVPTSGLVWATSTAHTNGALGIGTSSPWARFSLVSETNSVPSFLVATTSSWNNYGTQHPLIFLIATSSGDKNYTRLLIGTSTQGNIGALDHLYVDGRINSSHFYFGGDLGACTSQTTVVSNTNNACMGLAFFEDTDGAIETHTSGLAAVRLRASSSGGLAINEGAHIGSGGQLDIKATSSPVMEASIRAYSGTGNHRAEVGFTDRTTSTPLEDEPDNGMYFRFVGSTNWYAVTRSGGTETETDTGIAVDSTHFQKLRIEVTDVYVRFAIDATTVAIHTTNIPTTNSLGFGAGNVLATSTALGVRYLDVKTLKVWHR